MQRFIMATVATIAAACGALGIGGCPPTQSGRPIPINVADGWQAEYIATGVSRISSIAPYSGGRVLLAERDTGRIRLIEDGELLAAPLAEVPVNAAGSRGLIDIALHPNFNLNGRVYAFYSRSDTGATTNDPRAIVDHRVVYFEVDVDSAEWSVTGGEVFVASLPARSGTSRIGGHIAFGDKDVLFVALGDQEDGEAAQDDEIVLGKVLRYNDDGSIPDDNPSADSPIFAKGFRNPVGLAYDTEIEQPFCVDDAGRGIYEVNRVIVRGNYGWPTTRGFATTPDEKAFASANASYFDPMLETINWDLVGAAFNPDAKYGADLQMRLFYGASDRQQIVNTDFSEDRIDARRTEVFATGLPGTLYDVAFTPAGTLYVASSEGILRILRAD